MADRPLPFESSINRRQLLRIGSVAVAGLVSTSILAACGASAANGSIGSSTSPTSSPSSGSPKPAASAAPSTAAGSSAANAGAAAVPSTWDELVAAAKSEGKVVVTGAPDTDTRQKLPAAFKDRFGIEVEYLPGATEVTARLQGERVAGQYTLDAEVNGSDSIYGTLLANGWLDPLKPALLMPEVADGSKWKTGSPWFRDPKGDTALQIFSTLSQ